MQGKLVKNQIGRWEIVNNSGERIELTSGDLVDVKIVETWFTTRIEHNGDDYYATVPGIKLYQGMTARETR